MKYNQIANSITIIALSVNIIVLSDFEAPYTYLMGILIGLQVSLIVFYLVKDK